jgi:catechol-2,3-dioxygenase
MTRPALALGIRMATDVGPRDVREQEGSVSNHPDSGVAPAAVAHYATAEAIPFGGFAKLGHAAFRTRDVDRLAEYYRDVIGLTVLDQSTDAAHLTSGVGGQTVALYRGNADGLAHIGLQLASDFGVEDAQRILTALDVPVERKSDAEPGISDLLEMTDPEGNTLQLYHDASSVQNGFSGRGIQPHKLGHICVRARDVEGLCDWYERVLGFRWSDWIGDFFVFIRLGADHHALNLLRGEQSGNILHHIAYELRDMTHVQEALDHLARSGFILEWGPGRHGPGHNVFTYHYDPDGNVVELFTQLDVMNEALGAFEPRPWHADNPQRPKRWQPDRLTPNSWGITPPESFL